MEDVKQLRGIVAKRLSHLTEATTHLVTEAETTQEYCKRKNIFVVAETEDLDVSGGMPIRERPKVGPWLTLDHLDDWDVLVLYKLDRGFRNHLDFVTFYHEFCEIHGKMIVSVTQDIDMSTRLGKFFAGQLVQFAEWELMEMSARRSQAASVIRRAARWGGGSFTFGYEPYRVEEGDRKVWYLRPHPAYSRETVRMALMLLSGKSAGSIAENLNERGVPTARDVQNRFSGKPLKRYQWTTSAVVQHLRSDATRGFVLHYANGAGKPPIRVIDPESGEFVRREPLIEDDLFLQVQARLDVNIKKLSGVRAGSAPLLQIAFCGYCGAALHQESSSKRDGHKQDYYQCRYTRRRHGHRHCERSRSVPRRDLEEVVFGTLLDVVGDCEVTRTDIIAAEDNRVALQQVGMKIADLTTQHYTRGAIPDFHARMAELEDEYARISELKPEKPRIRRVGTGKTFRQRWGEMDPEQRRSYLKSAGVSAMVVLAEDIGQAMRSSRATEVAENLVLDIPTNVVRMIGDRFAVNISLGTLGEQLQRASAA